MMNKQQNPLKNTRLEFHILQSFPVTCLNRDDVGAPKTAMVGGQTRARVSSQCWKRQVRMAMQEFGAGLGTRTKLIAGLIAKACKELEASDEQAEACGAKIEQIFIKKKEASNKKGKDSEVDQESSDNEKTDTLLFLSPKEVRTIAEQFAAHDFDPAAVITQKDAKKQAKELANLIGEVNEHVDALDIALFGRMVAQAAELNVEAAASFAHAISTHKVSNEVEFFTALDDRQEEPGSAHMGSLEFNSATYYRYISLDLGQLWQNLGGQEISRSVEAFIKALYVAVPAARQATQSGTCPWGYARVLVRKGQRLQAPFETAVRAKEGGYLASSIEALQAFLSKHEKLSGSLYGKQGDYEFGVNEGFSIDDLIAALKKHAEVSYD